MNGMINALSSISPRWGARIASLGGGDATQGQPAGYGSTGEEDEVLRGLAAQTMQPYRPGWAALPGVASSIVGGLAAAKLRENAAEKQRMDQQAWQPWVKQMTGGSPPMPSGTVTPPPAVAPKPSAPPQAQGYQPQPTMPNGPAIGGGSMPPPVPSADNRPMMMQSAPAMTQDRVAAASPGMPTAVPQSMTAAAPSAPPAAAAAPVATQPSQGEPVTARRSALGSALQSEMARIDAERASLAGALSNPRTQAVAVQRLQQLEDRANTVRQRMIELDDPAKQLAIEQAQLDIQKQRRELENPKGTLEKLKGDEGLVMIDPRTGEAKRIVEPQNQGPFKDAKQKSDVEEGLRKEVVSAAKPFIDTRDAFNRIEASAAKPSPAADISLIFNFMKMLDPGSVVREGEFATAARAGAVPEQVWAMYNRLVSGERLTDNIRADFVGQARGLYARAQEQFNALQSQYRGIAKRMGIDERNVILDMGQSTGPARVQSEEQYRQLPRGASYIGPDGQVRVKNE